MNSIRLFVLLIVLAGTCIPAEAQNGVDESGISLESIILDKTSGNIIAYATILNLSNQQGTVSNLTGVYRIDDVFPEDTITISFIGYLTLKARAITLKGKDTIFLQRASVELDELIILADDAYLYEIIDGVDKTGANEIKSAKTYLSLESYIEEEQVELVECYYNGLYSTYNINELDLKNGRIALASRDERFFISTGTSRAILMHNIFQKSNYFPRSPFELSKRQARKHFQLKLNSTYWDDYNRRIYVVEYAPRKNMSDYFSGKAWIDSISGQLLKVELNVQQTNISPFLPLWKTDEIEAIDFNISKTFNEVEGNRYTESVDFIYHIHYNDRLDSGYTVTTNAILYAYDYSDNFSLPYFRFSEGRYPDYVKISSVPYNNFFWDNIQEFKLADINLKNESFVKNRAVIKNRDIFLETSIFKSGLYSPGYVFWSKGRIIFSDVIADTSVKIDDKYKFPSNAYNLSAQIYLDVNHFNDSLNLLSRTIFDPFESFYNLPRTSESNAFINIYFDLMEIKRRELMQDLFRDGDSEEKIKQLYITKLAEADLYLEKYLDKVDRGTNREEMKKWNDIVYRELGIDNIKFFNIYQDMK